MGAPGSPSYYSLSDLKSKFLNIAQTSIYHVRFEVPPAVSSFISQRGVTRENVSDIELLCSEATLPGTSLATHEATNDYHGVTEKMAYRRIYDETLNLSFYVDRNYDVVEYFDSWIDYASGLGSTFSRGDYENPDTPYRMNYPSKYKCNMYLVKYEKDIGSYLEYTFVKAFPVTVTSTPITYQQSDLLKYDVSFSYIRYVRERKFANKPGPKEDPRSPGVVELNSKKFNKKSFFDPSSVEKLINTRFPEYYNNGIDGRNFNQQQAPGDRLQDATNFSRDIA